ncbi:hypothetical protein CWB99_22020 [Pseudoalteromonas rubra]|uniref:DUF885 domain-containing protein n=1 Tax=Pseudoalteromonas rubra TaxID=43658 RepID=A0A5S3WFH7_9GAMM|nr:hypothetical protein [Pseudoalteromonas rubra]TMP24598.1 hypothetical protein CWB99_22020 [Pseudoalteromonas rubra]TMP27966.1 hypothetical protein CWC00_22440 [Pseudoalteromonas rubra]
MMAVGCTDPQVPISYENLSKQLKQLNWFAYQSSSEQADKMLELPFTEPYLEQRHNLLARADLDSLTETAQQEIQYLSIQQRYPERFLPWPAHLNIAKIAQQQLTSSQLDDWYKYVELRLNAARESKIVLSRVEKQQLLDYLTPDVTRHSSAAQELVAYLESYRVRSSLGMYQLPNGKEWYQSKLNFYSGSVRAPEALFGELQSLAGKTNDAPMKINVGMYEPVVHQLLANCDKVPGLNWRDGFVSLSQTVSQCKKTLTKGEAQVALSMMEVDLGVHYFAWSQKQALLALQSRLALNEDQAFVVLKNILFYPATSFVLLESVISV